LMKSDYLQVKRVHSLFRVNLLKVELEIDFFTLE
jgi:hypothetical protein